MRLEPHWRLATAALPHAAFGASRAANVAAPRASCGWWLVKRLVIREDAASCSGRVPHIAPRVARAQVC